MDDILNMQVFKTKHDVFELNQDISFIQNKIDLLTAANF